MQQGLFITKNINHSFITFCFLSCSKRYVQTTPFENYVLLGLGIHFCLGLKLCNRKWIRMKVNHGMNNVNEVTERNLSFASDNCRENFGEDSLTFSP